MTCHLPFLQRPRSLARQRGAALLMAMVIVTLVATMASSMVWQQWRAAQVEGSERVRTQAGWVLVGALDWARLILKEDYKSAQDVDHLGEPWAVPLAESRLSTFLAADTSNTASDEDDSPEAFLSGKVEDAQAKFNLFRLVDGQGALVPEQVLAFRTLCESIGLAPTLADGVAAAYQRSRLVQVYAASQDPAVLAQLGGEAGRLQAPLVPWTVDQLLWLGLDALTVDRLRPYVTLLPEETRVNVNTASKEVIAAVVPNLDMGRAQRLVQARQRKPFKTAQDILDVTGPMVPTTLVPDPLSGLDFKSEFFEVSGRLRYDDNIIEQRHLVRRMQASDVVVLHQSRFSGVEPAVPPASPR